MGSHPRRHHCRHRLLWAERAVPGLRQARGVRRVGRDPRDGCRGDVRRLQAARLAVTTAEVRGETRWAACASVVAVAIAQLLLPGQLLPGPNWMLPVVEVLLVVGLVGADPNRLTPESRDLRLLALVMVAVVGAVNAATLVLLIRELLNG